MVFSAASSAELTEVLMRKKFGRHVSQESRKGFLDVWRSAAFLVPALLCRILCCMGILPMPLGLTDAIRNFETMLPIMKGETFP